MLTTGVKDWEIKSAVCEVKKPVSLIFTRCIAAVLIISSVGSITGRMEVEAGGTEWSVW